MSSQAINWSWVAGFFEGEGNIYWQEGKKGTKQGAHGRLTIGQKCKEPLQVLYDFLISEGLAPRLYQRKTGIWVIVVAIRENVIEFLKQVEPMLFQKREDAVFVREWLEGLIAERKHMLEFATALRREGISWREIARRAGVGRVAVTNYFRAAGIAIESESEKPDFDRGAWNRGWRQDRINRGLCVSCGEPRGDDGTSWCCRPCADCRNEYSREWKRNRRALKRLQAIRGSTL